MSDAALRYHLDLTRPGHEIAVTATFPDPPVRQGEVRAYVPRWAPGSYLMREFARFVDWIEAQQAGRRLRVTKTTTDGWTIEGVAAGGAPLVVRYGLYAHELTVRTNYLAADRALICGAATYLVPEGCESRPARVSIDVPAGWPAAECPLPLVEGEHAARDYDELVDSPVAAGPCETATFDVRGVEHRIAVFGHGDTRADALAEDAKAIAEAAADVFDGRVPCPSYLFIIELGSGGGLEHAASSVCGFATRAFASDSERRKSLGLLAHEYFHLWNIKRIRPRGLGPFDYRRESHVPHLWFAEGVTSYYQNVLCLRAGLMSPATFLATWALHAHEAESSPGDTRQSLVESSHDAWTKYYRQHENSSNAQVSYYGKGALAGLVLDLEIRARTGGERGLDHAFRALWRSYLETGAGYDDAELRAALSEAAGSSMDDVVDEVAGRADRLDVDARLATAGLLLDRREAPRAGALGAWLKRGEPRVIVERVLHSGAAWTARIGPGEEIVAMDGWRVDEGELRARLEAHRAGDEVTLTTVLAGRLREVRVTLGARRPHEYRMRKASSAGSRERAVLDGWLGTSWDELTLPDAPHEDAVRAARPI